VILIKHAIGSNFLIHKYFVSNFLFFKDLADAALKVLIPKDRDSRGPSPIPQDEPMEGELVHG
jgi:hypothetical protein